MFNTFVVLAWFKSRLDGHACWCSIGRQDTCPAVLVRLGRERLAILNRSQVVQIRLGKTEKWLATVQGTCVAQYTRGSRIHNNMLQSPSFPSLMLLPYG